MKATCRKCGDSFTIDKEALSFLDEGYIIIADVNICSDCFDLMENTDFEYEQFSDADPGL